MPLLVRHPDTPPGAIHTVEAEVRRGPKGMIATFRATGDVEQLRVPPETAGKRADGLWKTTCFELFVGGTGDAYREFNFSPSGAWACYGFDGHRSGMQEAEAAVTIRTAVDNKTLQLVAHVECQVPDPALIGVTAVIEEADGRLRYWASSFAPGPPDFHATATRSLILDGVDAQ